MKKLSLILLTGLLSLSLASCGDKEVEVDTTKTFDLVQNEVNFSKLGEYKALECKYGEDAVIDVKYSIDNADICDLLNGVVIAKNFGEAKVTATYKIGDVTKTDTCNVKVNEPTIDTTKTFDLVQSEVNFSKLGEYKELECKYGEDAVIDVKYTIDNAEICDLVNGVVIAKNFGEAKVTATYKIGDVTKTDTCDVKVNEPVVDTTKTFDLVLGDANNRYIINKLGHTEKLVCKYGDEVVTDVTYTSSTNSVVIENGILIAKANGGSKVEATYKIGDVVKKDTCIVMVQPKIAMKINDVNGEALNKDKTYTLHIGEKLSVTTEVTDVPSVSDSLNSGVSYSITNDSIASLETPKNNANGSFTKISTATVTANKIGTLKLNIRTNVCIIGFDMGSSALIQYAKETIIINIVE